MFEGGDGFLEILEGEGMEAGLGMKAAHVVVVGGGDPFLPPSLPALAGGEELEGFFVVLS